MRGARQLPSSKPCARWIVAGHKNKDLDDDATRTIAETRDYLDAVDELLPKHTTVLAFFIAMLERFPDRLNPTALWAGRRRSTHDHDLVLVAGPAGSATDTAALFGAVVAFSMTHCRFSVVAGMPRRPP
jgi:hypothetical protein